MCKQPPEKDLETNTMNNTVENNKLADARNKLRQIELISPCSPSPPSIPMDQPKLVSKPIVIPTEKIPVVESRRYDSAKK